MVAKKVVDLFALSIFAFYMTLEMFHFVLGKDDFLFNKLMFSILELGQRVLRT